MNYFPMFLDIRDREVLICGGGRHGVEKVLRLAPFGARLRMISREISREAEELGKSVRDIVIEKRCFSEKDLDILPAFVIAAEDRSENERIADICRKRHVPVNAVDMQDICDFIFPAMITSGDLCVGISTGGASPAAAVELKKRMLAALPGNIDEILRRMGEIRGRVREAVPEKERQKAVFREIVERAFLENRPLEEKELNEIMAGFYRLT